jgi:hypothetical protein
MTLAVLVGAAVVGALALVVAIGTPVGRALHRAAHRNGVANPAACAPWCVRERAAALLRQSRP